MAIVTVAIAPITCAVIGDRLQHMFLPEVYWALPISVASFYTPIWWGFSLRWLALRAGVRHWALSWGVVGTIVFVAGRLAYWWPSQRDLDLGTVSGLIEERLSGHVVGNWIVILLGISTYVCLSVATKQILSAQRLKRAASFQIKSERDQRLLTRGVSITVAVVCVGVDGWVAVEPSLPSERSTSAAAFHGRWWDGVRFFHRDGVCYEVASATFEQQLSPLSEILSSTFYNPRLSVRYEYRSIGSYEFEALKQALIEAVEKGDDTLTVSESKARLNLSRSFDDVTEVLRFASEDVA